MIKFKNEYEKNEIWKKNPNQTDLKKPEQETNHGKKSKKNLETGENQNKLGPAQFRS
jgi:hypothetical protein